jgi:RHS repeat-associated protein
VFPEPAWTYDALGRVTHRTQTTDMVELETGYSYDALGHMQSLTTPSGQVIGYTYTSGRVTRITVNSAPLLEGITYQPFGPTTGWEWGNGATTVRSYDTDGQLTYVSSAGASTYTYFADGNIKSRVDDYTASIPTTAGTTTFTLASTSNRLTAASGLLTRSYSYDASGNTLSDGSRSFTYDDSGRMETSTSGGVTTTYAYNGLGERVMKTNATATKYFAYDEAGHILGEYDEDGELIQETVWFEGMPVATLRPDGGSGVDIYYVHADHLNTPRRVTDPSDNEIVWRWDSEPYGATEADEDPDDDTNALTYNLRFPGQYFDDETGLHYNYFRDYDSTIGRYVESDPVGLWAALSTYPYGNSNPLMVFDPYGLFGMDDVFGAVYHVTGGWTPSQTVVDLSAGFGDGIVDVLSFGYVELGDVRQRLGIDGGVDECSWIYRGGHFAGATSGVVLTGAALAKVAGWTVSFDRYRKAGGGGINVLKSGARKFGLDWHRFKVNGRMVNRPHYHRGPTKSQMGKHRPWEGGW